MSDSGGHGGEVSGNTFQSSGAAQSGSYNTQINQYWNSEPPRPPRPPRRRPLIAGAVVMVLALSGGIWAVVESGSHGSSNAAGNGGSGVASTTPSSTPVRTGTSRDGQDTQAPAPSASLPSPSGSPYLYRGTVRIAEDGPQLDYSTPRMAGAFEADVRMALIDPPRISGPAGGDPPPTLARWSGAKMPTRQQCSDLVSTNGVKTLEARKGEVVCLTTQGGRVAVLTILSVTSDWDTGIQAEAVVWSEVSEPASG